ncbi:uncharacterized protein LOC128741366 [Sabethes cyaneus]|uniref:uncharacterized protein LOC128741366 n=1 Tax=Sabethes cyaneus TaxID=53552 RepID=UPI00237E7010|nr:uncharacterized protein LOC128741366 [Sabethes cyaneus]XP_053693118.1 uncharacterized protein LOC128741366 [Sabethes cyaneus]
MKATLWLWSLVTALLYVSQQVAAEPYTDTRILQPQDNSLVAPAKRTKPSLSIVNPLDVLRQRIILEMARRQMRENTRQAEINKALLREIGKRSHRDFAPSEDDGPVRRFSRTHFTYHQQPILRRYGPSPERAFPDSVDYELLEPTTNRKTTSRANNYRTSNQNGAATMDEQSPINSGNNSPSSSSNGDSGVLTLAQQQRQLMEQLEREQQPQVHVEVLHPQELRFSSDDRLLPPNRFPINHSENGSEEDEEYFSNRIQKFPEQTQPANDKLKSDDYRSSDLFNMQDKLFG